MSKSFNYRANYDRDYLLETLSRVDTAIRVANEDWAMDEETIAAVELFVAYLKDSVPTPALLPTPYGTLRLVWGRMLPDIMIEFTGDLVLITLWPFHEGAQVLAAVPFSMESEGIEDNVVGLLDSWASGDWIVPIA